jgi:hypothetical protein
MAHTRHLEQLLVSVDTDHLRAEAMEARGNLAHSTAKVEYSLTSLQRNAGKGLIPMSPSLCPFILCG